MTLREIAQDLKFWSADGWVKLFNGDILELTISQGIHILVVGVVLFLVGSGWFGVIGDYFNRQK
jgi:hypothetical protein